MPFYRQNYQKSSARAEFARGLALDTLCNIWHHEWCDIYHGGLCNCDPQIEFQPLARPGEVN